MIITSQIEIDLIRSGDTPEAEAVQDDQYSRDLEIALSAGGQPWQIPAGTLAAIRYIKPDGTGGSYDTMPDGTAAYSFSGNVIRIALAPQVCTAAGLVRLAVCLTDGDSQLNTFTVNLVVHRNPGIDAVSGDYTNMTAYLRSWGWPPNMYLATDGNGDVVAVEDVSAALPRATAIRIVRQGSFIDVATTREDGSCSTSRMTLDSGGLPSGIVTDGAECDVSWSGFDNSILGVWEGGSY